MWRICLVNPVFSNRSTAGCSIGLGRERPVHTCSTRAGTLAQTCLLITYKPGTVAHWVVCTSMSMCCFQPDLENRQRKGLEIRLKELELRHAENKQLAKERKFAVRYHKVC